MAAPTRWGIAGAGRISADFVTALRLLPAGHHRVVAVAARSLQTAEDFTAKYGGERACGSYAELAEDPEIDVVYVGVLHTKHLEVASLMLRGGKHVLCEKPLCMNVRQTKALLEEARRNKRFLLEGVWSRFFPVYKELQRRLQAGEIGEVVHVTARMFADLRTVERLQKKELGGGVTLDLGLYPVQLVTLVMGGERPLRVAAGGHLNAHGVDETVSASLVYSKGRVASVSSSMKAHVPSEALIVGTGGCIKVPSPVHCPESLEGPSGAFTCPLPRGGTFNFPNSEGLLYEAEEVRRCLQEGLLESPGMTHRDTLTVAEVMEAIRTQAGTVYPEDAA